MSLESGNKAPEFSVKNQDEQVISLTDLKGKNIVLYFYPKDSTPGCTTEARDFTALKAEFDNKNAIVLGVSKDSIKSHQNFCKKQALSIDLLSDTEGELCDAYGVWKEKSMYGKTYMGIERSTFLIDAEGNIGQVWRKVKVKNHAQEVLDSI